MAQPTNSDHPAPHSFVAVALKLLQNSNFPERCGVEHATFREKLRRVIDRTLAYVRVFADLLFFGRDEDRIKRIKEKTLQDDFDELTDFVGQLNTYQERCKTSCQNVTAATDDLLSSIHEAIQNLRDLEKSENRKKNATRAVGGAATAGVLAAGVGTGVTLSIIAGVFTFGVGTIVGLALTAAGTAVVGTGMAAGTGAATHYIASGFAEAESTCKQLSELCNNLLSSSSRMDSYIRSLGVEVESIAANLENVQNVQRSHNARPSLISELECLWQRFSEFDYETFVGMRRELETRGSDFMRN